MGATGALAPARPKRQRRTRGDMFFGAKRARGAAKGGGEKTWTRGFRSTTATPIRVQAKTNGHGFGDGIGDCAMPFGDVPGQPEQRASRRSRRRTAATEVERVEQVDDLRTARQRSNRAPNAGGERSKEMDRSAVNSLDPRLAVKGHEPSRSRATRPMQTAVNEEAARGTGRRQFISGPERFPQSPRPPRRE